MCGRYVFYPDEKIYMRYRTQNRLIKLNVSYNVAPGRNMPVIKRNSPILLNLCVGG